MALDARHFSRVLTRAFLVPLLALAALAAVMAWETTALVSAMRWVDHTDQVTTQARYLLRLILDEETGTRGYLLTGDESFLQPYREAQPRVSAAFQTLFSLTIDNPDQQRRLERIRTETLQWQGNVDRMIQLRRSGNTTIDTGLLLEARRRMDTIRGVRDEFLEREEGLRDQRVQSLVRRTIAVLITPSVSALPSASCWASGRGAR